MSIKDNYLYKLYHNLRYKELKFLYPYIMNKQEMNNYLFEALNDEKPFMACRLGSEELKVINRYLHNKHFEDNLKYTISNNAGFFPPSENNLKKFSRMYLHYLQMNDFLAVWFNKGELEIVKKFTPKLGLLKDYSSPFFCDNPWTRVLKNKKVLVISPFKKSIENQYKNRKLLFENTDILPDFDLKVIEAVQSIGGSHNKFHNWFEALEYMKSEIIKIDFDISLIGAGAYGLPLAGFCKEIGKKGIHLGGALQLLFGIYGNRWIDNPDYNKLFNKFWIRPYEKPVNYKKVENGCYW